MRDDPNKFKFHFPGGGAEASGKFAILVCALLLVVLTLILRH